VGNDIGNAIAQAVGRMVVIAVIVAFVAGAVLMWALPKLWHLIKPLIHGWTA